MRASKLPVCLRIAFCVSASLPVRHMPVLRLPVCPSAYRPSVCLHLAYLPHALLSVCQFDFWIFASCLSSSYPSALLPVCLSAFWVRPAFPPHTCPTPALFPSTPICHLPVQLLYPPSSCPLHACLPVCLSHPLAVYPSAYELPACPNLLLARASTTCQPPASLPVCKSSSWSSACLDSCFLILQAVSVCRCSFCFCKALYKFLAAQCTPRKGTLFALCKLAQPWDLELIQTFVKICVFKRHLFFSV
jgi:hypothetical protein